MIACGVNNVDILLGDTPAFCFATDILGNDFTTCMGKKIVELDSNFNTYSNMTQAQGKIRLQLGIKSNIKAFIQWVRDEKCLGRNPETVAFPLVQAPALLLRYKTHTKFVSSASNLVDAAKPRYHPSTPWGDQVGQEVGFSCMMSLVPTGAKDVLLKSNAPSNCA